MEVNTRLIADASTLAGADIHGVNTTIAIYDSWIQLYNRDGKPEYLKKAYEQEALLQKFVAARKNGKHTTIRQIKEEERKNDEDKRIRENHDYPTRS